MSLIAQKREKIILGYGYGRLTVEEISVTFNIGALEINQQNIVNPRRLSPLITGLVDSTTECRVPYPR